jgi:hypothetical protein
MKTLSLFTTRKPIQNLKKSVTSIFLSLITSHAISTTQGRAYNFLYVIISRQRLCHRSPQDKQSKFREKVWPLVLLSLGMVCITPGNSFLLVYIRLGISSKAKKRMKIIPVCEAINSSRRVFSIQIFCVIPPNWNGLFSLVASIGTSRAEHTTFYMSYQQIDTLLLLTTRQFLQWNFIYIHIFRQSI